MKLNYKHLGRRIREERIRARVSQARLAEMTDSSPQYISHIENARKKASLGLIVRVANALEISVDQLLSESLTGSSYPGDAELSLLLSGCSNYERRVILDSAKALRSILKQTGWIVLADKE